MLLVELPFEMLSLVFIYLHPSDVSNLEFSGFPSLFLWSVFSSALTRRYRNSLCMKMLDYVRSKEIQNPQDYKFISGLTLRIYELKLKLESLRKFAIQEHEEMMLEGISYADSVNRDDEDRDDYFHLCKVMSHAECCVNLWFDLKQTFLYRALTLNTTWRPIHFLVKDLKTPFYFMTDMEVNETRLIQLFPSNFNVTRHLNSFFREFLQLISQYEEIRSPKILLMERRMFQELTQMGWHFDENEPSIDCSLCLTRLSPCSMRSLHTSVPLTFYHYSWKTFTDSYNNRDNYRYFH